jgi:hypothetical protein
MIDRLIEPACPCARSGYQLRRCNERKLVGERLWISILRQEAEFVSLHLLQRLLGPVPFAWADQRRLSGFSV